jgi:hypothetical protein
MPTIADTLKARWKPEYRDRTNLESAFNTALSFMGAGGAKRSELEKRGTLSPKGVAEAVREFAGKGVIPELKKFRERVAAERANLKQRRAALGKPKVDPTDLAAAMLRQEYRSYVRSLGLGDRARVLLSDDMEMIAAVLEVPPALSGLADDLLARVVDHYIEKTAGGELKAIEETEEALSLVQAAVGVAELDLKPHLGMQEHEFRSFMQAA